MWYETLPAVGALILVTYLPTVLLPLYEEFMNKNKYYKNTDLLEVRRFWFRDMYFTGDGNIPTRADAIPDLPETK